MGIFDFIRKKKVSSGDKTNPRRVQDNGKRLSEFPELHDAWLKFQTDYLDEAKDVASKYLEAADPNLADEALKLVGLVSFRKGEYQTALPMFEKIAKKTEKATNLFNVMTCCAMLGDVESANQAFERTVALYTSGDTEDVPPLPLIWYYFGCTLRDGGHPDKALPMIEKLRAVYEELKITDDTFLYIRGVPCLSHTMSLGMDVFRAIEREFDACGWLHDFSKSLDEDGQAYLTTLADELDCQQER